MDRDIIIYFSDKNIKKYIIGSEELIIKKESFKIVNAASLYTNSMFIICIDSQEKIYILNKIFDFFIKHKCFFYTTDFLLFDIDKDLFYKSGFWFLNSEEYWGIFPCYIVIYLSLTYNDKVVKIIEYLIDNNKIAAINARMDLDLGIIDFLISKCKSELSKEKYIKFLERLLNSVYLYTRDLIKNYGIKFFKCMRKNNILSLLKQINENYFFAIVYNSIKTNQTEIIDYLLKYNFPKDKVKLNDDNFDLLISLIENDNTETFMYTIQNVSLPDMLIQKMIEGSGEFITKEYVQILLNNRKLDLDNLDLLNKSIKNNPDTKLKKYVKNLILNEKN